MTLFQKKHNNLNAEMTYQGTQVVAELGQTERGLRDLLDLVGGAGGLRIHVADCSNQLTGSSERGAGLNRLLNSSGGFSTKTLGCGQRCKTGSNRAESMPSAFAAEHFFPVEYWASMERLRTVQPAAQV